MREGEPSCAPTCQEAAAHVPLRAKPRARHAALFRRIGNRAGRCGPGAGSTFPPECMAERASTRPRAFPLLRERILVCRRCPDPHPRCAGLRATYRQLSTVADFDSAGQPIGGGADGSTGHERDRLLVQRAMARDRGAADELAVRMRCIGRILAARNRRAGAPLRVEDLEDLCQDVATTLWAQLAAYRGIGTIEAWTHGYCDHAFRNAARRRFRERRLLQDATDAAALADPTTASAGVEDPLRRCLQRLSDEQQRILHRKHYDGATLGDIAAESGANLNTLKSQYSRALHDLRICMGCEDRR
ncbi:MAG TPA: sigma-70 family RNA polymerase sigma factor [Planctomycetota bacterium]|nr:sigma-70 family RNA polymerase sigma factor [Planctomycetota bacterium]